MNTGNIGLFPLLFMALLSCTNSGKIDTAAKMITEWVNRTICFSESTEIINTNNDTTLRELNANNKEYKILLYVDSSGCLACKSNMFIWIPLIKEMESKVDFLFYFQGNKKLILPLLKESRFKYPVRIDKYDSLNLLNHFPRHPDYQCFLLNKNNKVLAIGNPSTHPQIWNFYRKIITGKTDTQLLFTTVEPTQTELFINNLQVGKTSESAFTLKNTGSQPLVVQMVNASCGCTVPEWDKQPVMPGKTAKVRVRITPENAGYFNKTVTVHCNTEKGSIALKVSGSVKN